MIRILAAALHVVLRRDMSLNRRLYAWLLGMKYTHTQTHWYSHVTRFWTGWSKSQFNQI